MARYERNPMGRRNAGVLLMILGGALMAAALALALYNGWDEFRARAAAEGVVVRLEEAVPRQAPSPAEDSAAAESGVEAPVQTPPRYVEFPEMEMPRIDIDGHACLGVLELPALELSLPVLAQCTDSELKYAPCRYAGSVYQDDMVIAGHNYTSHFGRLRSLRQGDSVYFTDADGNRFAYTVSDLETLAPDDVADMTAGDWDLTLFTCTYGNRQRLAVRCFRTES